MSSPSSNKPIKVTVNKNWFTGLPDINKLTPQEALILAQGKYKPGMVVESMTKNTFFTIKNPPRFQYNSHPAYCDYIYADGMVIFVVSRQQWARIISGAKGPITKDQKEHILNLIKSI